MSIITALFSTYKRRRKSVNLCRLPKAGRDVALKDGLGHEGLLLDGLVDEGGGILQLSQLSLLSSEPTIIYGYRTLRRSNPNLSQDFVFPKKNVRLIFLTKLKKTVIKNKSF
jgi:hypothetical protein